MNKTIIAAIVFCIVTLSLGADDSGDPLEITGSEFVQGQMRAAKRAISNNIIPRLKNTLSPAEQRQFDRIRIKVIEGVDINAAANPVTGRIVIPAGIIIAIDNIASATAAAKNSPNLFPKIEGYCDELYQLYRESRREHTATIYFGGFAPYAGLSRKQWQTITSSEEYKRDYEAILIESLFFVIAHEVGHVILKHPPYSAVTPAEARAQEYAADMFAAKCILKNKSSVFVACTSLLLFSQMESEGPPHGTHPSATCRLRAVLSAEIDANDENEEYKQILARNGTSIEALRNLVANIPSDCEPNTTAK